MKTTMTNISDLANYIHSPDCKSIAFLTGAGVSVASGIPDFRSPGGMYDTLRPELLTCNEFERNLMKIDPTHVVNWDMFKNNAFPYLEVRRPFILGTRNRQWKATIAHRFAELLHKKTEKLTRVYTCNIDGLYGQCNSIPNEKIVNVHGSLDKISCEGCGRGMDYDEFCNTVAKNIKDIYGIDPSAPKESSPVLCPACNNPLMKPSTVLFGRSLPDEFWSRTEQDLPHVDLLIIAGTSLVIAPANSLVYTVPKTCRRVVVNLNEVGKGLGLDYSTTNDERRSDLFLQGGCDEIFLQLIQELGWVESLDIDCLPKASAKMVKEAREKIKNIA